MKKITHWIDKSRKEIPIGEMEIGYLYNTVKMIWNNVVAPSHPFGNVIHWDFKPPHTRDYLISFFNVGMEILMLEAENKEIFKFVEHVDDTFDEMFIPILRELDEDAFDINEFGDKD